jgi:myo-inositol 2-dehydrogenase/D-chiro-inositol 1-dehydrogenase
MLVGFNRRFDPDFRELKTRIERGAVGKVELVQITSRDPGLPPLGYLKVAGGLFRDMTIHDFDMARWLLGEEPAEVFAHGTCLVDPMVKRVGDIDTAVVTLRTASGSLAVITNSRRTSYGYDQRIEVHGSKGCLSAGNRIETTVRQADGRGVAGAKPLHFFLERYAAAYRAELDAFINALRAKKKMPVVPQTGAKRWCLLKRRCARCELGAQ